MNKAADIYWITLPDPDPDPDCLEPEPKPRGRLGLMAKPDVSAAARVFDSMADQGVGLLVSLLENAEAEKGGLQDEALYCKARSIDFLQYSIPDYGIPQRSEEFLALVKRIRCELAAGCNVVAHCWGGVGRSGLLCSAVCIAAGQSHDAAIQLVSKARGVEVPETRRQKKYIYSLDKAFA